MTQRRKKTPKSGTILVKAQKRDGQSFKFFLTNLENTFMKLVLVFGIARIFFVGAYAKSVTKTGATQAN